MEINCVYIDGNKWIKNKKYLNNFDLFVLKIDIVE
jgi:hypothetical protein